MENTGSTKIPFGNFYGEKLNIICSLSEFRRIEYVTKRGKIKKKMMDKTYKAIMVGYAYNHMRYTYKL